MHADPSAELPLTAMILDATFHLSSKKMGARTIPAVDFFLGPMFTATDETECLTAIEWPVWIAHGVGSAFDEISIRHGDFAMASAAAQVQLDANGICLRASVGAGGVDGVPLAFPQFAKRLLGARLDDSLIGSIAADAAAACEPGGDIHADAQYRRQLVRVLVARVLRQAEQAAKSSLRSI